MRYRLMIFDWDGTLMDSVARIVACMQAAGRDIGWGELPEASVRDIIGLGLPEAIAKLCPGIDPDRAEALRSRYAYHFVEGDVTPMPFYPGVAEGIARLRGDGRTRLAVATGKSRRGLDRIFRESECGHWFHASRTADETRSKPHPQMLEELLDELGVPAEEAVMIGDTEYDLEMARALGMDRVAVTYGVHAPDRLAASRPVFTAEAFPELIDWLHA
ncbi:HAD family hydrolase [Halomonas beimenensis]|uniref:Phosphoglycolate phosphatase, clustered with ribosomal large subunit pseudouridine synthase C n=1 Tax=Halomonas beimenensis TaxID=475662 RepID=A0A291P5T9_9GAMM|nr:HAD-IA family hydrolase [Halomonas beimenensis]ATJ82228.1 phosphoglycolate phosphatase, clustered with ribosomal large subunit pseudouridine synthase C [Halomonas beimenensis]